MKWGWRIFHIPVGTDAFPRFAIADTKGRFWTGSRWTDFPHQAILYADEDDAEKEAAAMDYSVPMRRFTGRIIVDVNAKEDFTLEDLKAYLELLSAQVLDDDNGIPSPLNEADIAIVPDWESLEEATDE